MEERWAEMCEDVCTTCGSCLGTEGRGWTALQHTHVRSLRRKISELWLAKSYFLFGTEIKNTELNIPEAGRRYTSFIVKKREMLILCCTSLVSIFHCQQVSPIKGQ